MQQRKWFAFLLAFCLALSACQPIQPLATEEITPIVEQSEAEATPAREVGPGTNAAEFPKLHAEWTSYTKSSHSTVQATLIPPRPILYFEFGMENSGGVIKAVDLDGTNQGSIYVMGIGQLLGWSHQGDRFAYLTNGGGGDASQLRVATLGEEGESVFESEAGMMAITWGRQSAWSPDGTQIALVLGNETSGSVVLVDVASGEISDDFPLPPDLSLAELRANGYPSFVKWSPDGEKLLLGLNQLIVLDVRSGAMQRVHDKPVFQMADHVEWLPDSDSLIYLSIVPNEPTQHPQLWLQRLGEGPLLLLTNEQVATLGLDSALTYSINLSPLATYLAVAAVGEPRQVGSIGNTVITRFETASLMSETSTGGAAILGVETLQLPALIASLEWSADEQALAFMMVSDKGLTLEVLPWAEGKSNTVVELASVEFAAFLMVTAFNLVSWVP